ncbi:hypothetical protein ABMA28_006924 [Loxostege sticticalis]|uniref:Uncharacterized protein n=1 Tax=Loxostege sticticalis TaxID=481309 RepID=A0ABD0TP64_LOXSC
MGGRHGGASRLRGGCHQANTPAQPLKPNMLSPFTEVSWSKYEFNTADRRAADHELTHTLHYQSTNNRPHGFHATATSTCSRSNLPTQPTNTTPTDFTATVGEGTQKLLPLCEAVQQREQRRPPEDTLPRFLLRIQQSISHKSNRWN